LLHLGHAFAALTAAAAAAADGGAFLLRMEDLDATRARHEFELAIEEDLAWLGLSWQCPVLRQSARLAAYKAALESLMAKDLVYPCFCTRRQVAVEAARAAEAPNSVDGPIYPGTCRDLTSAERASRISRGDPHVLRLATAEASRRVGPLMFDELGSGPSGEQGRVAVNPMVLGDIVLARRDAPAAYHLAVVIDDSYQGVSLVTRGNDLFIATHVQRLLQALLGLPAPLYAHHRLIRDAGGVKLSKRRGSKALQDLRREGWQVVDVRRALSLD
jgi:glutamyl-Q tRNA(Asp) synthetase